MGLFLCVYGGRGSGIPLVFWSFLLVVGFLSVSEVSNRIRSVGWVCGSGCPPSGVGKMGVGW